VSRRVGGTFKVGKDLEGTHIALSSRQEDRADLAREQSAEGRVRCLTSGMENDDIARDLVVTPRTVAKHVEHILLKLGVHSRAQAIALAFRENIAGAN